MKRNARYSSRSLICIASSPARWIAAAHAILDEEREKNLLGLLSGTTDPAESLAEIAKVLSSATPRAWSAIYPNWSRRLQFGAMNPV
jgi:hypothetical protein